MAKNKDRGRQQSQQPRRQQSQQPGRQQSQQPSQGAGRQQTGAGTPERRQNEPGHRQPR